MYTNGLIGTRITDRNTGADRSSGVTVGRRYAVGLYIYIYIYSNLIQLHYDVFS